MTNLGKQCKST